MLLNKLKKSPKKLLKIIKKNWPEVILVVFAFCFSWWLMWHTFDYKNGQMLIAAKVWSDFAANIPLIRSFSWGKNWPPEYPLFPGEPIRYHFLFYFLVGLLEKIGLPLDWALNLPSTLGFFGLLVIIYLLTKIIFNKRSVALLAVVFFLFNSSLSFLEFFRQHPLSLNTLSEIISNRSFPSFGPYDGKIISAFWSLNIYTNQRHLGASYFFVLLIVYLLLKSIKKDKKLKKWHILLISFLFGIMPFFHKVAFLMTGLILFLFFLFFVKLRRPILIVGLLAGILAVPQIFYQTGKFGVVSFHPGYLITYPLTLKKFFYYWFQNLGLSLILIPVGFWLSNKLAKKLFLAVLPFFVIGNLFQFSPEIAANHKFFNLFIIVGNMFSAFTIYWIWQKKFLGKVIAPILVFLMTFSGIIDFFPIKNDIIYAIDDAPKNPVVLWIRQNTPPDATFLNSSFLYHPASLAGRKIFLGWPYFPWSAGYNTEERERIMRNIYENRNSQEICRLLEEKKIDYFTVENILNDPNLPKIESRFFKENFKYSFKDPNSGMQIYSVKDNCF
jgi:hypothetical protein